MQHVTTRRPHHRRSNDDHLAGQPGGTRPSQKQHALLKQAKAEYGCGLLFEGSQQQRHVGGAQLVGVKEAGDGEGDLEGVLGER